jgi:predicted permease
MLGNDVRYATRSLLRSPLLSGAAVLTIGLGIGANTAMFGVVDRLFLQPPPHVVEPDRVVSLDFRQVFPNWGVVTGSISTYPEYLQFRDHARSFSALSVYGPAAADFSLGLGEHAERVRGRMVSASFFPTLGVRPVAGRFFADDEDSLGHPAHVAVLSDEFWKRHFDRNPAALGTTLPLGRILYTVIGVAPAGFGGVGLDVPDLWLPLTAAAPEVMGETALSANWSWLRGIARLAPGVSREAAKPEATAVFRSTASQRSDWDTTSIALLTPILDPATNGRSEPIKLALWLSVACGIVLLIACANVANLLLARAVQRRREISVRLALGAGRLALARQLLAEAGVLATAGGGVAILVSLWVGPILQAYFLPHAPVSGIDVRLALFTLGAVLGTLVLAGMAPAIQASAPDLSEALKSGAREGSTHRSGLRSALLASQMALTLALLTGAGLFISSLRHARGIALGFDADRLIAASVNFTPLGYSRRDIDAIYDGMREGTRAVPGVTGVSLAAGSVFGSSVGVQVRTPDRDTMPTLPTGSPIVTAVTPDYFTTLGIRVLRGRGFTADDITGAQRVAVVNSTMAGLYWPNQNPLGKCLDLMVRFRCTEVVGVAADGHIFTLLEPPHLQFYIPLAQRDSSANLSWPVAALFVRTRETAAHVEGAVLRAVQSSSPQLPYPDINLVSSRFDLGLRSWRLGSILLGVFGGLGLLLAAIGVFGALSYMVSQRTQELGIRVALGAARRDLLALVVGQGLRVAGIGIVFGVAGALMAGRGLASQLYGVSPNDPVVLTIVIVVLLLVAAFASYLPALRATRVDPMVALRAE